jgi:cell division septation protein DedD
MNFQRLEHFDLETLRDRYHWHVTHLALFAALTFVFAAVNMVPVVIENSCSATKGENPFEQDVAMCVGRPLKEFRNKKTTIAKKSNAKKIEKPKTEVAKAVEFENSNLQAYVVMAPPSAMRDVESLPVRKPSALPTQAGSLLSTARYTVQVASEYTVKDAERKVAKFTKLGFEAYYVASTVNGKSRYRVNVGKFLDYNSAREYRDYLRGQGLVTKAIVFKSFEKLTDKNVNTTSLKRENYVFSATRAF